MIEALGLESMSTPNPAYQTGKLPSRGAYLAWQNVSTAGGAVKGQSAHSAYSNYHSNC